MRAYAVVKKQVPIVEERTIKFTKPQPPTSIQSIPENMLANLHRGTQQKAVHELSNKGAYYRFSYQSSSQKDGQNNQQLQPQIISSFHVKEEKLNQKPEIPFFQSPRQHIVLVEQQKPIKVARQKKIFEQFAPSPINNLSQHIDQQSKINATPIKIIQNHQNTTILQSNQPTLKIPQFHQNNESHRQYPQQRQNLFKNVIFEESSKNVFCCGEEDYSNIPKKEQNIRSSMYQHPDNISKSVHYPKRKIFEEFKAVTSGEPQFVKAKIQRSIAEQNKPQPKLLKIKIYQFSNIIPFDI